LAALRLEVIKEGRMTNADVHLESSAVGPGMTAFEREQIQVERLKAWLTAGSIIVSVVAALLAYLSTQRIQSQQAAVAFDLKVAEIVMAGRGAWEAKGRAKALAKLFPHRVSDSIAEKFDPASLAYGRESKRELLTLLTAHPISPNRQAAVLKTWKAVFRNDLWVDSIAPIR
jgi:hypothetical protein